MQIEKPMDPLRLTQLVTWLDEEHRKDKAELQILRERLAAQSPVLENQATQLRELNAQFSAQKTQLARLAPLEEALSQAKGQMAQLQELQNRRQEEGERTAQIRKTEIEQLGKARATLEQRVETLAREAGAPLPRLQALTEDYKRVMAVFPQFEAIRQQVNALAVRLPVFEADDKRTADRVTALERAAEDIRNQQVRIGEDHRLGLEEQKRLFQDGTAQAQTVQRRYEELSTVLQHLIAERGKGQEQIIGLQTQIETLRQSIQGQEGRLKRLEEQNLLQNRSALYLEEIVAQLQQEQARLAHLLTAAEHRIGDEVPPLRKALGELDTQSREAHGQLAQLTLEQQRDRDTLNELRKGTAAQADRQEQGFTTLMQFQEQNLRHQINALQQRLQEAQKLVKPTVGEP